MDLPEHQANGIEIVVRADLYARAYARHNKSAYPERNAMKREIQVLVDAHRGAVEANAALREAVGALKSALLCGERLTPELQAVVRRGLDHPGGR